MCLEEKMLDIGNYNIKNLIYTIRGKQVMLDKEVAMLYHYETKKNKDVEVVVLTSDKSNISKLDIQKFNKEYPILKVAKTDKFHDRFIAIDNKELYHCGASIKDLGKKCFGINIIEDENIIKKIIEI